MRRFGGKVHAWHCCSVLRECFLKNTKEKSKSIVPLDKPLRSRSVNSSTTYCQARLFTVPVSYSWRVTNTSSNVCYGISLELQVFSLSVQISRLASVCSEGQSMVYR